MELFEILQHTAHVVLGKVDAHTPKHDSDKSTAHHTTNHHASQNPRKLISMMMIAFIITLGEIM